MIEAGLIQSLNRCDSFVLDLFVLKDNPPSEDDYIMVIQMARIGLFPGETFDLDRFDSSVQAAIIEAPMIALDLIALKQMGWV